MLATQPTQMKVVLAGLLESSSQPYYEHISLFRNTRVTSARISIDGTTVLGANALDVANSPVQFNAGITIDATEFGDFLPLAQIPYRIGFESQQDTGELHAPATAIPTCVNPITYPFFLERIPGTSWPTEPPPNYQALAEFYYKRPCMEIKYPDFWTNAPEPRCERNDWRFWNWRRTHWPGQFLLGGNVEQTQINWAGDRYPTTLAAPNKGGNDFNRNCLNGSPSGCEVVEGPDRDDKLAKAQELSRGFAYFTQTMIAPSQGNNTEWRLAGGETAAAFGSEFDDGFSPIPYVRESRRIRAVRTVREQDISRDYHWPQGGWPPPRAPRFPDSIGIGHYHFDLHDCAGGDPFVFPIDYCNPPPAWANGKLWSLPYQVPLGALIPATGLGGPTEGFLASSKNIGTTHITNGAYRLQPTEWQIGVASAAAAVVSLQYPQHSPRYMATNHEPQFGQAERPHVEALRRLQQVLVRTLRSPLYWWADVWDSYPDDPNPAAAAALFEAAHMVAADEIMLQAPPSPPPAPQTLTMNFDPEAVVKREAGALIILRTIHTMVPLDTLCSGTAFIDVPCPPDPSPNANFYSWIQPLKNAGALITNQAASCPDGNITSTLFQPNCELKRRDWIRFLVLAKGIPLSAVGSRHYSDVLPGDPDFRYVDAAWKAGLVDKTSGTFEPDQPLRRKHAAIMAYNAMRKYYHLD